MSKNQNIAATLFNYTR